MTNKMFTRPSKPVEAQEMLEDLRAYDDAKARIEAGEELIPSTVAYALLDGKNPIRVWREYRGLTQQQLAEKVGISKPYLSQLESGKRSGTTDVLMSIAQALNVGLEELVDTNIDSE